MKRFLVLTAIVNLIISANPVFANKKSKADTINLRVSPRIINNIFIEPRVFLTVQILDLSEKLYCSDITINWGDGSKDSQESDCAPYEDVATVSAGDPNKKTAPDPEEGRRVYEHVYKFTGVFYIEVTFSKTGKIISRQGVKVSINANSPGE